jgi:hypothetical protein
VNQYLGDQSKWTTNQKTYSSVVYDDLRPGVDMVVESTLKALKYTLRVAPGADASNLRFRYEGARAVQVVENGAAVEALNEAGILRESGLVCYQDGLEGRKAVDARYELTGPSEYAIVLGEYDPAFPLTIDPAIGWSTLYGGNNSPTGMDESYAVTYSPVNGDIYVAGTTFCINFPPSSRPITR